MKNFLLMPPNSLQRSSVKKYMVSLVNCCLLWLFKTSGRMKIRRVSGSSQENASTRGISVERINCKGHLLRKRGTEEEVGSVGTGTSEETQALPVMSPFLPTSVSQQGLLLTNPTLRNRVCKSWPLTIQKGTGKGNGSEQTGKKSLGHQ